MEATADSFVVEEDEELTSRERRKRAELQKFKKARKVPPIKGEVIPPQFNEGCFGKIITNAAGDVYVGHRELFDRDKRQHYFPSGGPGKDFTKFTTNSLCEYKDPSPKFREEAKGKIPFKASSPRVSNGYRNKWAPCPYEEKTKLKSSEGMRPWVAGVKSRPPLAEYKYHSDPYIKRMEQPKPRLSSSSPKNSFQRFEYIEEGRMPEKKTAKKKKAERRVKPYEPKRSGFPTYHSEPYSDNPLRSMSSIEKRAEHPPVFRPPAHKSSRFTSLTKH